ncbi:cytochrome b N-terminal domain-containing protein [Plebeiibacterium marinum]|uniref:Cytochrome b N-terminal domain-containing protein n=1 Tax=Plebeiibacterium marinum TaxID=2992111 RepID=A0AAE3MCR8_9BACT|nr:cytochrome b N-terminal domain-containing protein [Plebeiobacterium marinum]MCW3805548.1 cytochrome b N-terminal domain-containing protein [Plebeiobacterium marinum]
MAVKSTGTKIPSSIQKFLLHLHPVKIDSRATNFTHTFGLGGISALLFVLLCFTGLILRFSYIPTVEHAYESILALQSNTIFGQFIRNLHHLSAKLLVIASFLHLIRVLYTQSIYKKRAENWVYGLLMMFLVVASSFTGYLLPWDQLAYWAVTVITQIIEYIPGVGHHIANLVRGSETVDGNTLLNFYSLHTGIFPILFIFLMCMHFWLVRKAGGVALPKTKEKNKVDVISHLVWKEVMVASLVLAGIFLVAVFYHAPLLHQANPLKSPNPSKAPWYFLGAQELLLHVHPVFSAVIIPITMGFFFLYLPYFNFLKPNTGVWFNSALGKKITIQSGIFSFVYTFVLIYILDHFLHFDLWFKSWPSWIATGLIPFSLYMGPALGFLSFWDKKHKANKTELMMASVTILFASYICMLLISLLLRGKGMLLIF